MTGPESFGEELDEKNSFGKRLYEKNKWELDTLEKVYKKFDVADPGTDNEGAKAVFEAMRQKQKRLTAAHDAAKAQIQDILKKS